MILGLMEALDLGMLLVKQVVHRLLQRRTLTRRLLQRRFQLIALLFFSRHRSTVVLQDLFELTLQLARQGLRVLDLLLRHGEAVLELFNRGEVPTVRRERDDGTVVQFDLPTTTTAAGTSPLLTKRLTRTKRLDLRLEPCHNLPEFRCGKLFVDGDAVLDHLRTLREPECA